jgi:membrane-associated phospholipid phosphatase/predicted MFS family arabinose efflux permease
MSPSAEMSRSAEMSHSAASPPRTVRRQWPRRALFAFSLAAVGAGTARGLTTTYLPVLLERIDDEPTLIGAVMTVNALAGFAVPLAVGVWSDRRDASGLGRRLPYMIGGTVLAAGGLVAVGLGNGTSYIALGLAAAVVYVGLNALTTAHRALIAEDVADDRRPAATSAQELAAALGAGAAVGIGGALIEPAPGVAFGLAAGVLIAAALPTLLQARRLGLGAAAQPRPSGSARRSLLGALHTPGAREVLLAQTLWVFAYAALPAFFVLYAEKELDLGLGAAGALPLTFGLLVAAGMVAGGKVRSEQVHPTLILGASLLGVGLVLTTLTTNVALVAVLLAPAALGAGLLTALGFPYFARFVPPGEAGGYSGVFFAARGVASAVALPLAGLSVQLTGTYRSIFLLGGASLLALAPLIAAERRRAGAFNLRPRPAAVAAVVPVFASDRAAEVAGATLKHVDELVLVDDGAPPEIARSLNPLLDDDRVQLVSLGGNSGKGTAVAAGARRLLDNGRSPEAIVVLDSDGQHDPERIPAFLEAARSADVVVGWRRERRSMPLHRRVANRLASFALLAASRVWVPDTQNGMRLFRTEALRAVPPPDGGYEAESVHLRALLAERRRVAPVAIPTIYDGEPSHFRPLADTAAVARALVASPHAADDDSGTQPLRPAVLREWAPRLGTLLAASIAIAAALPALQPLDSASFRAINQLGDGPEWLYHALDPHSRNYVLLFLLAVLGSAVMLRRARYVLGAALAVVLAGYLGGVALELVKVFVDRARPEEVLGSQVLLAEDRNWSHIASYPSGHMMVTAALAAVAATVAPVLRRPLIAYVAAVALTRVLFGAHFPLDVLVGTVLGYEIGLFATALIANARLLPARLATDTGRRHRLEAEHAMEGVRP